MNLTQTWRNWILVWVFLTFIGTQVIESTHHHESEALQDACAVCQLVAHQPLNAPPPATALIAVALPLLFIFSHWREAVRIADARRASYDSRAPPHTA